MKRCWVLTVVALLLYSASGLREIAVAESIRAGSIFARRAPQNLPRIKMQIEQVATGLAGHQFRTIAAEVVGGEIPDWLRVGPIADESS